jgi:hypothetical protein
MKTQLRLLALLSLALAASAQSGAPVYRVGTGCDFATIQAAINAIPANGEGVLRIRHGTYNENVFIANKSVELIGGHTSCSAPEPGEFGLSAINAAGSAQPALIYLVGDNRELRLVNLNLANGTGLSDPDIDPFNPYPAGGLSVWTNANAVATVELDNSSVFDNTSVFRGAGIALLGDGSGSLTLRNNSRIFSNTVTGDNARGGGMYCQGNYHVVIFGGSVNNNTAGGVHRGDGGGLYLDGCGLGWAAYLQTESSADDASLRDNIAHGDGGGLYATGGANVLLIGANGDNPADPSSRPLRISGNQALDDAQPSTIGFAGAIYAEGPGTVITADRAWIHDNHARRIGGAVYARDGALVNLVRSQQRCHSPRNCSRIFNNTAVDLGAAIYARGIGTQVNVVRSILADNRVEGFTSSPIYIADGPTLVMIDSLMFGDVESGYAITLWDSGGGFGAPVNSFIVRSTIADTRPTVAMFRLVGNNVSLQIHGSILHETNASDIVSVATSSNPTVETDCMLWHRDELSSLGPSTRTVVGDPQFLDREQGLYYLQSTSPAINFCDGPAPGSAFDLEWFPRGLLHSGQPEQFGPYDLGAYEIPLQLFRDRFEEM